MGCVIEELRVESFPRTPFMLDMGLTSRLLTFSLETNFCERAKVNREGEKKWQLD